MIKLLSASIFVINLPFRIEFKHNLANRKNSLNIILKIDLNYNNKIISGFGESAPRIYVSGETSESCFNFLESNICSILQQLDLNSPETFKSSALEIIESCLDNKLPNTAICAFDLALNDLIAKLYNRPIANCHADKIEPQNYRYGAVIPYLSYNKFKLLFTYYKLLGYKTIKLKLGKDLDHNLKIVKFAIANSENNISIRADANRAFEYNSAINHINQLAQLGLVSIEEPCAYDYEKLSKIQKNIPIPIILDESLIQINENNNKFECCGGFNIRLSKNGGLLNSIRLANIAANHNLECHLGAQVGESLILTNANQNLATILKNKFDISIKNIEGAGNNFLLKYNFNNISLSDYFKTEFNNPNFVGSGISSINKNLLKYSTKNVVFNL